MFYEVVIKNPDGVGVFRQTFDTRAEAQLSVAKAKRLAVRAGHIGISYRIVKHVGVIPPRAE